jgi:hypothetical protein
MIQSACESRDDQLGEAANEYFEAIARGERPSIADYASRYPDIAEDIRRVFPALALVGDSTAGDARPVHIVDGADRASNSPALRTKPVPPPRWTTRTSLRSTPSAASVASITTQCSS